MRNELLKIGPFTIYGYGFMIALGIIAAFLIAEKRAKRNNLDSEQIVFLSVCTVLCGFLGAKLLYWITELPAFIKNPMSFFTTMADGFVVYGGIIGGIIGGFVISKIKMLDFLAYFDLMIPSIAIAQGFGRIGCFLAGCCYGKETKSALHIVFHSSWYAPNGVALIPTQLYSAGLDFIHFAILLLIAAKTRKKGVVAACYLIFYSAGRFILEFFRGDINRGSVGMLSTSQFIAVFVFVIGIAGLIWRSKTDVK
ncbi:MAG: prolipoprotein diacylglyceryl transferase [Eubacteriales bacterium]|nr:prolipoprotein diacylglyceryl transferase [Eubacteriales bacterium]